MDGKQTSKVINPVPLYFEDVRVLASGNFYHPAEGVISNLHVKTVPDGKSLFWNNFSSLTTTIHFVEQYSKIPDDIPLISQIFIQDQGQFIGNEKLKGTFSKWGPTYEIKFDVKLGLTFVRPGAYPLREIIKFSSGKGDCCLIGQRIPAVYFSKVEFMFIL